MASGLIYLGSTSPRRRELLAQIGVRYELVEVDIDEAPRAGEAPGAYVQRIALAKARTARDRAPRPYAPVLAADTVVVRGGERLGKPASEADCMRMLRLLSGAVHEVYTAVAVLSVRGESVAVNRSEVELRELAADEIAAYWRSGEPVDKAGGYAIQGLGAIFVRDLRGSYSGVMGLPLYETAELLRAHGMPVLGHAAPA